MTVLLDLSDQNPKIAVTCVGHDVTAGVTPKAVPNLAGVDISVASRVVVVLDLTVVEVGDHAVTALARGDGFTWSKRHPRHLHAIVLKENLFSHQQCLLINTLRAELKL